MHFFACLLAYIFLFIKQINAHDSIEIFYGYIPFWGVTLFGLAGLFLVIAILGLIGYILGCRTPLARHPPSTDSTAPFFVIQNFAMKI